MARATSVGRRAATGVSADAAGGIRRHGITRRGGNNDRLSTLWREVISLAGQTRRLLAGHVRHTSTKGIKIRASVYLDIAERTFGSRGSLSFLRWARLVADHLDRIQHTAAIIELVGRRQERLARHKRQRKARGSYCPSIRLRTDARYHRSAPRDTARAPAETAYRDSCCTSDAQSWLWALI